MTIFRNVFQKHLEQQETPPIPAEGDVGLTPENTQQALPGSILPPPTVPLPTAQTHDLPPPMAGKTSAAAKPAEVPTPSSETVLPSEADDDIAARAAEAQRLIQQSQASQQRPSHAAEQGADPAPRARTRLLGFGGADTGYVDPLADLDETPVQAKFPCGWLVIVAGPGRGESFALFPGVAQIGRGEDQTISLDFGDRAISREKHAVVAYDREAGEFYLGHGGKSNIIRLNDRPVLSTVEMAHGDTLRIGETTLRFCAFCDASFRWDEEET